MRQLCTLKQDVFFSERYLLSFYMLPIWKSTSISSSIQGQFTNWTVDYSRSKIDLHFFGLPLKQRLKTLHGYSQEFHAFTSEPVLRQISEMIVWP